MALPPPPYADAVCGEFLCGEALAGYWWAYPERKDLILAGEPPIYEQNQHLYAPTAPPLILRARKAVYVGVEWAFVAPPCTEIELVAVACDRLEEVAA